MSPGNRQGTDQYVIFSNNRRLDMVVWTSLPAEVRQDLGSEPLSFMENRRQVMEALERAGWPVKERDVVLLENEIKLGISYIKQVSGHSDSVKCCPFH